MTSTSHKKNLSLFTSKSNVLQFLQKKVKCSHIEKIFVFTVEDWNFDRNLILSKIHNNFLNKKIIVRSSAMGEDSEENSQAGSYESILNVKSNSKSDLISSISKVIKSYTDKSNNNIQNQILVQTQTQNIISSGVVFTRTSDTGSPYYVINYEDGESTVGVTHGSVNQTIKILRNSKNKKILKKWKLLISSIGEIELILKTNLLDIEFGITKGNDIIIFQVRPITSLQNSNVENLDTQIFNQVLKNQKKYLKLQNSSSILSKPLILSDMADWNPAEIIGSNPNPLDYSLYDYLIMKNAWFAGRLFLDYRSFKPHSLMMKFGNKPYVNTNISFASMIPKIIDTKLAKKLMKYYLKKLNQNPHLHDKVEFDILFTCYDLSVKDNLKELSSENFSKKEIKEIHDSLLKFTKNILESFPTIKKNCNVLILQMIKNRINKSKLISNSSNYKQKLELAEILLSDCKSLGTIPFSTMARIAFMATALLQSFVKKGFLTQTFMNNFMNSLNTPLSQFQNELILFSNGELSKKDFLTKFGHLRPGTYDITVERYDKDNPFLKNIKFTNSKSNKIKYHKNSIEKILNLNGFNLTSKEFFSFIHDSLTLREELKFEFTHNLSDALELISESGNDLGFFKDDLSYLEIETILKNYKKLSKLNLKKLLSKKIKINKKSQKRNDLLVLPPIISSIDDFELIEYHDAKPNYITTKITTSELISLNDLKNTQNIENKIILLDHADPGYDWIFTRNPAGLITKYGGVASHMSIRCSEVSLPAAIGCGEIIYEKLQNASKIMLDCKNNQIIVLEHEKQDEFFEQKKILKSLGYIK
jgi:phosphoenolpyruvate synthase/pyruvate phosphate dikinase